MPLDVLTPLRFVATVTSMSPGQYSLGRKRTTVSPVQDQAPSIGVGVETTSARSTSSLFLTGLSNVTVIGMPTPTVVPSDGSTDASTKSLGSTVRKASVRVVDTPRWSIAVAVTV